MFESIHTLVTKRSFHVNASGVYSKQLFQNSRNATLVDVHATATRRKESILALASIRTLNVHAPLVMSTLLAVIAFVDVHTSMTSNLVAMFATASMSTSEGLADLAVTTCPGYVTLVVVIAGIRDRVVLEALVADARTLDAFMATLELIGRANRNANT
jgi:hypothetical protein